MLHLHLFKLKQANKQLNKERLFQEIIGEVCSELGVWDGRRQAICTISCLPHAVSGLSHSEQEEDGTSYLQPQQILWEGELAFSFSSSFSTLLLLSHFLSLSPSPLPLILSLCVFFFLSLSPCFKCFLWTANYNQPHLLTQHHQLAPEFESTAPFLWMYPKTQGQFIPMRAVQLLISGARLGSKQ